MNIYNIQQIKDEYQEAKEMLTSLYNVMELGGQSDEVEAWLNEKVTDLVNEKRNLKFRALEALKEYNKQITKTE